MDKNNSNNICFVRSKATGKYLRGARVMPWVASWRNAAMMSPKIVSEYLEAGSLAKYGVNSLNDIDLITEPLQTNELAHT